MAIIGCGAVAEHIHMRNIRYIPEVRLKALVDTSIERAEHLAQKFSMRNIQTLTDYSELSKYDIDAVMILTPPSARAKIATDCAEAGMHIFCEKPIATTVEDAERIVECARTSNVKLTVGFNLRFLPHFVKIQKLMRTGTLGKIWGFSARFLTDLSAYPGVTRFQFKENEGGCLIDTGTHLIDTARWLFGDVEAVKASLKTLSYDIPVEDTATVNLFLHKGICGTIFVAWYCPRSIGLEVFGSEGIAYTQQNAVYYQRQGWISQDPAVIKINDPIPTHLTELKHFCKAIIEDREPPITGEDGVQALKIVKAAYKSSETDEIVYVNE